MSVCKTRFNVPQNSFFAPTDLLEPSDDGSNMLRVLTVLLLVIKESGHVVAGLEGGIEMCMPSLMPLDTFSLLTR